MKLRDIVDHNLTDKGTTHSYIPIYEELFPSENRKDIKNILEIGIAWGGSIKLWSDYFPNATIYAIDNEEQCKIPNWLGKYKRVKLFRGDGYSDEFIELIKDIKFDIIIDDGPHGSYQKVFVEKYINLVPENGTLVVEDVGRPEAAEMLGIFPQCNFITIEGTNSGADDRLLVYKKNKPQWWEKNE